MKKHRINGLTKRQFEGKFLREHNFGLVEYNFDIVDDIIYDWGNKEEKKQYKEHLDFAVSLGDEK